MTLGDAEVFIAEDLDGDDGVGDGCGWSGRRRRGRKINHSPDKPGYLHADLHRQRQWPCPYLCPVTLEILHALDAF